MGLFEFLLVIVAIVLSLGITELLSGVARILKGEIAGHPLHTLWIVIVFQFQLQLAWGLWGLRQRVAWRYPEFVLLLLAPVFLYLAAAVLFPPAGPESADLHLLRRRRDFFLLNLGYLWVTGLFGIFLFNEPLLSSYNALRLAVTVAYLTLAFTSKRGVQWAFGLLILAGHLWWTYQYTFVVAATSRGP